MRVNIIRAITIRSRMINNKTRLTILNSTITLCDHKTKQTTCTERLSHLYHSCYPGEGRSNPFCRSRQEGGGEGEITDPRDQEGNANG